MKLSDYVNIVDEDGSPLREARNKIKQHDKEMICRLYSYGAKAESLSKDYEVDVSTIYKIIRN